MVRTATRRTGSFRARRAGSWFEPLESKLHVPPARADLVPRPHLLEQLRASRDSPLVLVTAPPGYGKTTLLAQWAEDDPRPFVWITLDEGDNDPSRVLTYIIFAIADVMPLQTGVFPRPPEPGPSFTSFALPRLTRELARRVRPFVLVVDDVHVLTDPESIDVLSTLVLQMPAGSQLALAGREQPPLPLSRLLATHALVRIGAHHLAMTPTEALQLLHADGVPVGQSEAELIVRRTEGWPAGLHLAALSLREQDHLGRALDSFAGTDILITDYFRSELLERLPRERLAFMMGTAALERLSGPLCDAVLESSGSARVLEELEAANMFLTATDRNRVWYRRHALFAELLLAELRRRDPRRERTQLRRAAKWFEANADPDAAIVHARAAGDIELAARIIARHTVLYLATGRAATVRRWIEELPPAEAGAVPWFPAVATMAYISNGDVERAMHWMAMTERAAADEGDDVPLPDGRASMRSAAAICRAALGTDGVAALTRDATIAYELEDDDSPWRALSAYLQGVGFHLADAPDAERKLREASELAFDIPSVRAYSLTQLALCAVDRDDWDEARDLAETARAQVERSGLQEYAVAGIVYAVAALSSSHAHQAVEARRDAMRARRLLASLSGLVRWMGVQGRVAIADAYLHLGDVAAARETLRDAQRDLSRLHDAPALRARFDRAHRSVLDRYDVGTGPVLTAAELRVVQFLPTHLSFREIADRLHVSRNTVKTQVISAYRKLSVGTRTEAVESARRLGVVES